MLFPLYRRPGCITFLDDDQSYLEILGAVIPDEQQVCLFHRPKICAKALMDEQTAWDADFRTHQEMVLKWNTGGKLIPQILQYWRDDKVERFSITRICVVDYAMPAMNGIEFLQLISGWKGFRILLTGFADEQIAVGAFNSGLIQKYIPKQIPKLGAYLTNTISEFLKSSLTNYHQVWSATLSVKQLAYISDPLVSEQLEQLSQVHDWIEHIVIGVPFGLLAQNSAGTIQWLQLEAADNLQDLAELAELHSLNDTKVLSIKEGEALINFEMCQALDDGRSPELMPTILLTGNNFTLYAAIFDVYAPNADNSNCYSQLLTDFSERVTKD